MDYSSLNPGFLLSDTNETLYYIIAIKFCLHLVFILGGVKIGDFKSLEIKRRGLTVLQIEKIEEMKLEGIIY